MKTFNCHKLELLTESKSKDKCRLFLCHIELTFVVGAIAGDFGNHGPATLEISSAHALNSSFTELQACSESPICGSIKSGMQDTIATVSTFPCES